MSKRAIKLISPTSFRALLGARGQSRVIPVDGSWYMPNNPRNALKEFRESRLPDSRYFDVDGIKDAKSPYPHMLPSVEEFNAAVSQLDITPDDKLVVYDRVGNFSAPRVAWTFQTFGHDNVYLLENFPLHQLYSYPLDYSTEKIDNLQPSDFKSPEFDANAVLSFEQFVDIVSHKQKRDQYTILDARSFDRYSGAAPEPRPGLPSGHAPGARSLPFTRVLTDRNLILNAIELKQRLNAIGVTPDKPIIVMCGTGVTACILKAALDSIGYNKSGIQVYDGSWTEYAQRAGPELIVTGSE